MPGIKVVKELLENVAKPAMALADGLHTSKEEKGMLLLALKEAENKLIMHVISAEVSLAEVREHIIVAEAKAESWLTRTWRPIAMLTFLSIFPYSYLAMMFGWPGVGEALAAVPEKVWQLLMIGIGGYIPMRSIDKWVKDSNGNGVYDTMKDVLTKKKKKRKKRRGQDPVDPDDGE